VEQGVGATTDSGKLWIPRYTPLETVRQYGISLLGKVGRTLDNMAENQEYSKVLETLGIPSLPGISSIKKRILRNIVCDLVEHIVNMLLKNQNSRPSTVPLELVTEGTPSLFNYPLLQLTDPDERITAFWCDSEGNPQMVKVTHRVELRGT
jgi:hypothetical protein